MGAQQRPMHQQHQHQQRQAAAGGLAPEAVGKLVGQHKGRLHLGDSMAISGVLFFLFGIGGAAVTIPKIVDGIEPVSSLAFVPLLFAIGALLLWLTRRQMKQSLDVCERGFVHRIGGKVKVVPWCDVTGQRGVRTVGQNGQHKSFRVELALRDGTTLTFTSWLTDVYGFYNHVRSFIPPF